MSTKCQYVYIKSPYKNQWIWCWMTSGGIEMMSAGQKDQDGLATLQQNQIWGRSKDLPRIVRTSSVAQHNQHRTQMDTNGHSFKMFQSFESKCATHVTRVTSSIPLAFGNCRSFLAKFFPPRHLAAFEHGVLWHWFTFEPYKEMHIYVILYMYTVYYIYTVFIYNYIYIYTVDIFA